MSFTLNFSLTYLTATNKHLLRQNLKLFRQKKKITTQTNIIYLQQIPYLWYPIIYSPLFKHPLICKCLLTVEIYKKYCNLNAYWHHHIHPFISDFFFLLAFNTHFILYLFFFNILIFLRDVSPFNSLLPAFVHICMCCVCVLTSLK